MGIVHVVDKVYLAGNPTSSEEIPRDYNMDNETNAEIWVDGWKQSYRHKWMAKFRSLFFDIAFFENVKDKNARTLDVGCGTGFFINRLVERGWVHARGIEPDARLVPPQLADRIEIGSATRLPYAQRQFDCIFFFNVVHHLPSTDEYAAALREADRCVKEGGDIILLEPNWRFFYMAELFISKILSTFWPFAAGIHEALAAEWDLLMHFFDNKKFLKSFLTQMGYQVRRERHLIHQWILVCRKPNGPSNSYAGQ